MPAALAAIPAESKVGTAIAISGTGFIAAHAITIKVTEIEEAMDLTWTVTSDGSGNWSLPGTIVPQIPGLYNVSATDGTSTVTAQQKVQAG